ncbi:T9SS type A sorting domain-containing protein [Flammeovirga yaeyamensis]|uniref:T9SS type A sorting domain-containing protein n=1 Tax=Flammeovirga yaeyamensis TaxID=367791 RepID=A0AAX1N4L6_9BACT|nr:T9SS type A sorting domain-containing protein [Flammeovirga yaeyamensis]MBB3700440.1 hypothetical protein [Flammeovirga yaeyamensis]NMF36936.1 T9SS type A sorting domain-containing protein [Flammeovirga yaeyamensis]QWG02518.1 T9SS type A sorting domain-containing protein [Flammeovirga yaeyamensis]
MNFFNKANYFILFLILFFSTSKAQDKELWLTYLYGGENSLGSIVSTSLSSDEKSFQLEHQFKQKYNGHIDRLENVQIGNKVYNLFVNYGNFGAGGINEFDIETNQLIICLHFKANNTKIFYSHLFKYQNKLYALKTENDKVDTIVEFDLENQKIIELGNNLQSDIFDIAANDQNIIISSSDKIYSYDIENNTSKLLYTITNGSEIRIQIEDNHIYALNNYQFYKINISTNEVNVSNKFEILNLDINYNIDFIVEDGVIFGQTLFFSNENNTSQYELFTFNLTSNSYQQIKRFERYWNYLPFFRFNNSICYFNDSGINSHDHSFFKYNKENETFELAENSLQSEYIPNYDIIVTDYKMHFISVAHGEFFTYDDRSNSVTKASLLDDGQYKFTNTELIQNKDKVIFFTKDIIKGESYINTLDILTSEHQIIDKLPYPDINNSFHLENDSLIMYIPYSGIYNKGKFILYDLVNKQLKDLYTFSDLEAENNSSKFYKKGDKIYGYSRNKGSTQKPGIFEFDLNRQSLTYIYESDEDNFYPHQFYINSQGNLFYSVSIDNGQKVDFCEYSFGEKKVTKRTIVDEDYKYLTFKEYQDKIIVLYKPNDFTKPSIFRFFNKETWSITKDIIIPDDILIYYQKQFSINEGLLYFCSDNGWIRENNTKFYSLDLSTDLFKIEYEIDKNKGFGYSLSEYRNEIIIKEANDVQFEIPETIHLDKQELIPQISSNRLDDISLFSSNPEIAQIVDNKIRLKNEGEVNITLKQEDSPNQYGTIIYKTLKVENNQDINSINTNFLSINLYPNPTSQSFSIDKNIDSLNIYSTQGTLIKSFVEQPSYNISTLNPGIYIVKAMKNDDVYTGRIVLQ